MQAPFRSRGPQRPPPMQGGQRVSPGMYQMPGGQVMRSPGGRPPPGAMPTGGPQQPIQGQTWPLQRPGMGMPRAPQGGWGPPPHAMNDGQGFYNWPKFNQNPDPGFVPGQGIAAGEGNPNGEMHDMMYRFPPGQSPRFSGLVNDAASAMGIPMQPRQQWQPPANPQGLMSQPPTPRQQARTRFLARQGR